MTEVEFLTFEDPRTRSFLETSSYLSASYRDIFGRCGDGFCFIHSDCQPVSLPGVWVQTEKGRFLNSYPWYSMWAELWLRRTLQTREALVEAWREIGQAISAHFRTAVVVERPWDSWMPTVADDGADRVFYFMPDTAQSQLSYGRSTRQKLHQVERRGIQTQVLSSLKEYDFIDRFLEYYESRGIKTKPGFFWDIVESGLGKDFQAIVAIRGGEVLAGTLGAHLKIGTMAEGSFLTRRDKDCSVGMAAIMDYSIRNARANLFILGANDPKLEGISYFKADFGCKAIPYRYQTFGLPLTVRELGELMRLYPFFYFYPRHLCLDAD